MWISQNINLYYVLFGTREPWNILIHPEHMSERLELAFDIQCRMRSTRIFRSVWIHGFYYGFDGFNFWCVSNVIRWILWMFLIFSVAFSWLQPADEFCSQELIKVRRVLMYRFVYWLRIAWFKALVATHLKTEAGPYSKQGDLFLKLYRQRAKSKERTWYQEKQMLQTPVCQFQIYSLQTQYMCVAWNACSVNYLECNITVLILELF